MIEYLMELIKDCLDIAEEHDWIGRAEAGQELIMMLGQMRSIIQSMEDPQYNMAARVVEIVPLNGSGKLGENTFHELTRKFQHGLVLKALEDSEGSKPGQERRNKTAAKKLLGISNTTQSMEARTNGRASTSQRQRNRNRSRWIATTTMSTCLRCKRTATRVSPH